ncbi:MAG: pyruvate kinase [Bifidobacteriaceae bacterium]|nr:pyruvate kinase [Bifidobacteriaceae bacterium]
MPRAKIVCTLGPATASPERIAELIAAGMSVARLNLSHGDHAVHETSVTRVRAAARAAGTPVAILADLQGPKIRLGVFGDPSGAELKPGGTFIITTDDVVGSAERASTTFAGLPGDARVGDPILIDDGKIALRVTRVTASEVVTDVIVGGKVSDHKGINLPGVAVSVPALSAKDRTDLRWALGQGADLVALSFVRTAADYADVRAVMDEVGVVVPVIAKIEKPQAVDNLVEIVRAFDGIMVARGDLGVELPLEDVPLVQKYAIDLARRHAKPVIVATQMLESMITSARPTRAEASDCANAVLDGADALMLSGETSVGSFPVEAAATMVRIVEATEAGGRDRMAALSAAPHTRAGVLTRAAAQIGDTLNAKYLVTFTETGETARRMSRLRSPIPLLALTPNLRVLRELALSWGVTPLAVDVVSGIDEMIVEADNALRAAGLAERNDLIVIVSGAPLGVPGSTNQVMLHRVGELDVGEAGDREGES